MTVMRVEQGAALNGRYPENDACAFDRSELLAITEILSLYNCPWKHA
jgi:hypothetical protein